MLESGEKKTENPEQETSKSQNHGKLILDATCAPGDIKYPTDIEILNDARIQTEKIIDILYEQTKDKLDEKPRTYREKAKKEYLGFVKKRRDSRKERRRVIKKQLQYIKRNLAHIEQLVQLGATLGSLTKSQYKILLVVHEVYRQQKWLYDNKIGLWTNENSSHELKKIGTINYLSNFFN